MVVCNWEAGGTCDNSRGLPGQPDSPLSYLYTSAYAVSLPGMPVRGYPVPANLRKPTCCPTFSVSKMLSKAASSSKSAQIASQVKSFQKAPQSTFSVSFYIIKYL